MLDTTEERNTWLWDCMKCCSNSHSDGTHSLQMIHWRACHVMLNFSKSVLMKKQTQLHIGKPEGSLLSVRSSAHKLCPARLWS